MPSHLSLQAALAWTAEGGCGPGGRESARLARNRYRLIESSRSCHPERSRTIREASRSAESKDPYIRIGRRVARAFDLAGTIDARGAVSFAHFAKCLP